MLVQGTSNQLFLITDSDFYQHIIELRYEKTSILHMRKQRRRSAKLISAFVFVFATWIVQSLYFRHTKFPASSHLVWFYSSVCVGRGRTPRRPVFSQRGSFNPYLCGPIARRHKPSQTNSKENINTVAACHVSNGVICRFLSRRCGLTGEEIG